MTASHDPELFAGEIPVTSEELLAEVRRKHRMSPLSLAAGVFSTILIHAVVGYAAYFATTSEEEIDYLPPPLIDARLVKFGKPLPEGMLPKKLRAPPPPKKKTVGLTTDPDKIKDSDRPDDTPDPVDEEHTSKDESLLDSLDEFDDTAEAGAEVFEEGHESGVKGGTLTDPSKARAGDRFYTELVKLFRKEFSVPAGMTSDALEELAVKVHIEVSRSGRITEVEIVEKSGNALFDSAVRTAVSAVREIPDPPKEWEFVYIEGLTFEYKGADM